MSRVTLLPALVLLSGAGKAVAEPQEAQAAPRQAQAAQALPTGAEDAPRAAARSAAASAEAVDLETTTSRSSEGLTPVLHGDGTVSLDLEGRFMSVAVASPAAGGGHSVSCANHAGHTHAAGAPQRSRPSTPVDARAAARAEAGTIRLPAAAPAAPPPALEDR
jgi:hypothetical protein